MGMGSRPIFDHETRYTTEFADIACHDDQVAAAGVRGDQGIERADRRLAQKRSDATEVGRGDRVEVEDNLQSGDELLDLDKVVGDPARPKFPGLERERIADFVGAVVSSAISDGLPSG